MAITLNALGVDLPGWVGASFGAPTMHVYRQVWSAAGVRRLLLANLLSAIAIGAMAVAVLLALQARYGGLAAAGVSAGLFGVGNAIGLLIQGPMLDRKRQRATVVVAGSACVCVMVAVLIMINSAGAPAPVAVSVGFLCAGTFLPGITAAVRSRMAAHPQLVESRLAAYSALSVTFQTGVAIGPLLVSAVILMTGPQIGLVVPIIACAAAVGCFCSVRPGVVARTTMPVPQVINRRTHPIRSGVAVLAAAGFATGAASGMTAVGIPGVAASAGNADVSGLQFAAIAVGDLLGGLIYGARKASSRIVRPLLIGQTAALTCAVIAVVVSGSTALLTIVLLLGAASASPAGIAVSALLDRVARTDRIAASYTLVVSSGLIGSATASAAAGRLADGLGPRIPFYLAPACLAVALVIYLSWVRPGLVHNRGPDR